MFQNNFCFCFSSNKKKFLPPELFSLQIGPNLVNGTRQNHCAQWFRAQFGPILVYRKCQMFSFKMAFMLNLMLLLENYSPMMYFLPLTQQFCMPLSMLYFARPVWNHTTQWGSKLPRGGTFSWVGLHEK